MVMGKCIGNDQQGIEYGLRRITIIEERSGLVVYMSIQQGCKQTINTRCREFNPLVNSCTK